MNQPVAGASREVPVPWGHALRILVQDQPGGTTRVVSIIRGEVGDSIGSRPSFMNLYRAGGPEMLNLVEKQRAWYLIAACGEEPAAPKWGVADEFLPNATYNQRREIAARLRSLVRPNHQPTLDEEEVAVPVAV